MSLLNTLTRHWRAPLLGALGLLASSAATAAGLLTPTNSQYAALEIEQQHVNVTIEDGYAITRVEQVFRNNNTVDLEAIYSFPVPDKAAVAEFTYWIDGQPVTAEVLEKQQARAVYEQEKAAGREAGLTEKDDYRSFDIHVTPVRAQQSTRIRLAYLQSTHTDSGIGRYVYPLEEGGVDQQKLSFWTANEAVQQAFSFNLELKSAYPVEALRMPNQPRAQITQSDSQHWQLSLSNGANVDEAAETSQPQSTQAAFMLDQDLVVYWRHQNGLPGSVDLVTQREAGEPRGTFMLTLTPGDDLQPIQQGSDWVFVLDISGSMQGKYATLAEGVQQALGKMRVDDRFRIIVFNDRARELTQGYTLATADNIHYWSQQVAAVQPDRGTNLYAGLQQAIGQIDADRTSAIVLVTDGVANVGETEQRKFLDLLKGQDIRLFTFIMGNSANKPLLGSLTRASNGFAINVSNSDDIVGKILEASSKVTHQALHGVELHINGIKTSDLTPAHIGSLYRGQQLIVFGHYWGEGRAEIELSGKISGQAKSYKTAIEFPAVSTRNPEIERLWAYAKIEDLSQQIADFGSNADARQAITDLGIEYGLVTDYTSMLVVREEIFNALGIERHNQQRLQSEAAAQQQRAKLPASSHRADSQAPMFNSPRPNYSGSGGGALNGWMLLVLLPLLWLRQRMR